LRWTAPAAGTYRLKGVFRAVNSGATTDVKISKNETEPALFSGVVNGSQRQPFNFSVTVATGQTIDFSVGYGNGSNSGDATGLDLTISQPVTTYNARDEFALTQGGTNGFWNYGYSNSDTDNTFNAYVRSEAITPYCGGVAERYFDPTTPMEHRQSPATTGPPSVTTSHLKRSFFIRGQLAEERSSGGPHRRRASTRLMGCFRSKTHQRRPI
jgi:hypothetical protein